MNKTLWDFKARLYKIFRSGFPFNLILEQENSNFASLLNTIVVHNKKIVDIGVGTGNALQFLQTAGKVFAVDVSNEMLITVKNKYSQTILVQADALSLPYKSDFADIVVAIGLSEYIKNFDELLNEFLRILKPEGYILMTFTPQGLCSVLRFLLGHRIYPSKISKIIEIAQENYIDIVDVNRSLMQIQVLFHKCKK